MKTFIVIIFLILECSLRGGEYETYYFDVSYGNRKLPVKAYIPKNIKSPAPLILYSHGLGGSRETKKYLMEYWSKAGFVCIAVQHPGSDESVFKNAKRFQKFKALKKAANVTEFLNRTKDIPAVLNQIEKWIKDPNHPLYKKVDMSKIGMSGHSFGAITTQAVMGAKYPGGKNFEEKRFKAFLLMSPGKVPMISDQSKAFSHIIKPVFCMTGTEDKSPIRSGVGYKERVAVYYALPKKNKYLYVFYGGKHNLFSGPTKWNPKFIDEYSIIQKLSLWFWQMYLLGDKKAEKLLKDFKAKGKDKYLIN